MVVARDVVTITKEAAEMVNYREILRLSNDPQNGQRSIAAALHCSRDTIREVRVAAEKAGVSWPLDDTVTNEMLKRILQTNRLEIWCHHEAKNGLLRLWG